MTLTELPQRFEFRSPRRAAIVLCWALAGPLNPVAWLLMLAGVVPETAATPAAALSGVATPVLAAASLLTFKLARAGQATVSDILYFVLMGLFFGALVFPGAAMLPLLSDGVDAYLRGAGASYLVFLVMLSFPILLLTETGFQALSIGLALCATFGLAVAVSVRAVKTSEA